MGRLVKDHGPPLGQQFGQAFFFLAALHGQKTLKDPAAGVLSGDGQRSDAGAGPGHRHHRDAPLQCVPDDDLAGVRDAGHTGIRAQSAALPRLDPAQDAFALLQGVFVVADQRLFQTQVVQKPQGDTGVLRRNKIHCPKGGRHPGRHIVQVADGGGNQVESSGHEKPLLFYPSFVFTGHSRQPRCRSIRPAPPAGRCGGSSGLPPKRARARRRGCFLQRPGA